MKYFVVGGGSGGHLTPLIAVAEAIKQKEPSAEVIHIGQRKDILQEVVNAQVINTALHISAGKFRRYHGESFIKHALDIKTVALNIRDFFKFIFGFIQSLWLLGRHKPDVIFLKGGFVCVPIGYAARLYRIPYVTHDSDAIPGLANRLTAKHAKYNATALSAELYPYESAKTIQVGIPIQKTFKRVTKADQQKARNKLHFESDCKIILSVGGGLGAQRVNRALVQAAQALLTDEKVNIIHLTGKALFTETKQMYEDELSESYLNRIKLIDFTNELYEYSAAADIILSRAGATNIAEFAAQAKPCIFVPNPVLTGGQQLHNAKILEKRNAAIIIQESALSNLARVLSELLNDRKKQEALSEAIHSIAVPKSAEKIAELLQSVASNYGSK